MNVEDLINALQKFPKNAHITAYNLDQAEHHEIESIQPFDANQPVDDMKNPLAINYSDNNL